MRNHYENLKVPRNGTQAEIKAAYRKLRSAHHPDRNPDPRSTQRMQVINEAWEVLSDPSKRKKHDAEIARHEMLDDFIREAENASKKAAEEDVSTEDWEEPEPDDNEKIEAMQRYFEMAGASWVQEIRNSGTYARVDPTYRVYRTDFTVGSKVYYYYACHKGDLVDRWRQVQKELRSAANEYSSGTLSPRLANQELMDRILSNQGVLWSEGEPYGDVTGAFFRKG